MVWTLGGTYIAVRPPHLQAYVDEQIFRFDKRKNDDGPRFAKTVKGVDGKWLTYRALIAKD